MNKYLLTSLACSFWLCKGLFAQDFQGIWLSEYVEEIQKTTTTSILEDDSLFVEELGYTKVDTNYYNSYLLIDFISKDSLLFGGPGGKQTMGTYYLSNDTLNISLNTLELKAIYNEKYLKVLDPGSSWSNSTVFLSKLNEDDLALKGDIKNSSLLGHKWISSADSNSSYHGLEFYFYDSLNAIITLDYGERAYTSYGTYNLAYFKDIPFLGVLDRGNLDQYVFLLKSYLESQGRINVMAYELTKWIKEPPRAENFELIKQPLPSKNEIELIRKNIIGDWYNRQNPLPFDTIFSDYDSIMDSHFTISFNHNNSYSTDYGGKYLKDGNVHSKSLNFKGTWTLGRTGDYIELKTGRRLDYLTIINANENALSLTYDIQLPDAEVIIPGTLINMTKKGAR